MSTVDVQISGDTPTVLEPSLTDVIQAAMVIVAQAEAILVQVEQTGVSAGEYAAAAAAAATAAIAAANRAATGFTSIAPTQINDQDYTVLQTDLSIRYVTLTATRNVTLPDAMLYPNALPLVIADETGNCSSSIEINITPQSGQKMRGVVGDTASLIQPYASLSLRPTSTKDGWFYSS